MLIVAALGGWGFMEAQKRAWIRINEYDIRSEGSLQVGPTWFATPWLGGTCTRETYRFVPAHRMVQIVRRARRRPVEGR